MKKFLLLSILMFVSFGFIYSQPSFSDFWDWVEDSTYDIDVDQSSTLSQNFINIFYPTSWWEIWDVVRTVWVWIFFLFLVWWWAMFLLSQNDESKLKQAKMNLLYIGYWWVLFFWVVWILWSALNLWNIEWSWEVVDNVQEGIVFQVLSFLKAAAFFVAVIMIFYYWYRMIQAFDKDDKISEARKWVINVLLELVLIKIIDFVFYIAQADDFSTQAWELLVWIAQILWYLIGAAFVIAIFYSWFLMITSRWDEEAFNKWKNIIKTVFIIWLIIMLFLLIVYQVIWELA